MSPAPVALTRLTVAALVAQLAAGEVSAAAVVDAHIRRIEATQEALGAVVAPRFELARADAEDADACRAAGASTGPLHGVPFTVKESYDVAGLATTLSVPSRAGEIASRDAALVARMREAGAILLGKTNVPQLLVGWETDGPVYGRANNPWDTARSPGGSSGGEAAVIAAGGSALGLGSDIGGSIRVPAHLCGISGLLPTPGRLDPTGHPDIFAGLEAFTLQPGPMARTVGDLDLMMRAMTAGDARPWQDPGALEVAGLRVGLWDDDGGIRPAPGVRRAVAEAGAALEAAGATVVPWTPPEPRAAWRAYLGLLFGGLQSAPELLAGGPVDHRLARTLRSARLSRVSAWAGALGLRALGQARLAATTRHLYRRSEGALRELGAWRDDYRARFLGAWDAEGIDAVVCPPAALAAAPHDQSFWLGDGLSYATLFNLLGLPAGVAPVTRVAPGEESDRDPGRDWGLRAAAEAEGGSAGLPVGIQVAARPWREDLVLALLGVVEADARERPGFPAAPPL